MPNTTATMAWLNRSPDRLAIKSFTKEGTAIGRKYSLVLNGQWSDLDRILEKILTGQSGQGFELTDLLDLIPDFSQEAADILIPSGVQAFARTPRLEHAGEGDKSLLTIPFEEGLQEGTGGAGSEPVGENLNDEEAFAAGAGNSRVPANSSYRLVFEPDDVELGYGLPFRKGYKWDLTIQAPNLSAYSFPNPPDYEKTTNGTTTTLSATHPIDLIKALGYNDGNISILAVCNIWREGGVTEQQRGALFSYLSDGGGAPTNLGMQAYALRILRGETSYRYFLPHVSVTRRYRTPPVVPGYFPLPGQIAAAGTDGAPPAWCNAPKSMYMPGGDETKLAYTYWSTGPQVEFVGDQWQVEVQWNAFVDLDTNMYQNPLTADENID